MTVKEFVEKYNTFNNEESKMKVVDDIYAKLKDGSITVKNNNDDGSLFE